MSSSRFFSDPTLNTCGIYSHAFNIYFENFKNFVTLAGLQVLVQIPIFFVFIFIAFALFGTELVVLTNKSQEAGGMHRLLYESGSNYYNNDNSSYSNNTSGGDPASLVAGMIAIFIAFFVVEICISASFQGAFVRLTSEKLAGYSSSTWQGCLRLGWKKTLPLIGYNLVYGLFLILAAVIVALAIVLIAALAGSDSAGFGFFVFLAVVASIIVFIYISSVLIAGPSVIMVEGSGAIDALKRSWNLCNSSVLFIFCTVFCFSSMELIGRVLLEAVLSTGEDASDIATSKAIASLIMTFLLGPINAM